MNTIANVFARPLADNPAIVRLLDEDGCPVTRVDDATTLYPVDSNLSAAYDHPGGINVTREDAEAHGIEIEE